MEGLVLGAMIALVVMSLRKRKKKAQQFRDLQLRRDGYAALDALDRMVHPERDPTTLERPLQPTGFGRRSNPPVDIDRIKLREAQQVLEAQRKEQEIVFGREYHWPDEQGGHGAAVSEEISVVLRRQIPVCFDEPPRSWLGGLPMMPDEMEWPRGVNPEQASAGEVPLNFVAQISCEDLPKELWSGLGPRKGWLLYFLNPNSGCPEDKGTYRILHSLELGVERQPPADIGPVHDGVYTGCDYLSYLGLSQVPPTWRRWPVDLITVPNQLIEEDGRASATPPNFAAQLYPGTEIATDLLNRVHVEPFSWRCLSFGVDRAESGLSADPDPKGYIQKMRERLEEPGMFEDIVPALDRHEARFRAGAGAILDQPEPEDLDEFELNRRKQMRLRAAERAEFRNRVAAIFANHPSAGSLLQFIDQEAEGLAAWKRKTLAPLSALRSDVEAHGLDAPLTASKWRTLKAMLEEESHVYWAIAWGRSEEGKSPVTIEERTVTLFSFMDGAIRAGTHQVAADYYVHAERRSLLPDEVARILEPYWRQLHSNRPHRIGGYHDGVQSDAQPGPARELLMLQLATDYAMQWCWGDAGAYYAFIKVSDLREEKVGEAVLSLECH